MEGSRISTLAIEVKTMRRRWMQLVLPLLALCTIATVLYAGGWAVITLSEFPEYAVAGTPLTLRFAVRQHGQTLLSGLQPSVQATAPGGLSAKASAVPDSSAGEYKAVLMLPQAAEW